MGLDFNLSEEQKLIQDSVHQVLKPFEGRRDELRKMILKDKIFPQEVWNALADAGYMGCLIPEEYGGTNMGLLALTLAIEQMAVRGFSNGLMVLTAMDALCILRNGSPELKQRFLPGMASGEMKFCFALTEPNAGSNTFRLETIAKKEGDTYRINGQKVFITGVDHADYMLLVTRTMSIQEVTDKKMPKAFGLSLFIVPTNAKGMTKRAMPMRGIEGMTQWELFFDDVEVPAENLVGQENAGIMALFNSLNPESILAACIGCGITENMIN